MQSSSSKLDASAPLKVGGSPVLEFVLPDDIPIDPEATLDQLTGRFRSLRDGLPELVKNAKDQYSRPRDNGRSGSADRCHPEHRKAHPRNTRLCGRAGPKISRDGQSGRTRPPERRIWRLTSKPVMVTAARHSWSAVRQHARSWNRVLRAGAHARVSSTINPGAGTSPASLWWMVSNGGEVKAKLDLSFERLKPPAPEHLEESPQYAEPRSVS